MSRARKQDAWVATIKVSVPIDAADVGSIALAQKRVREVASLIPGSSVEITHAGFGRMAAATVVITPADVLAQMAPRETDHALMRQVQMEQALAADDLNPPDSLRRVPRIA